MTRPGRLIALYGAVAAALLVAALLPAVGQALASVALIAVVGVGYTAGVVRGDWSIPRRRIPGPGGGPVLVAGGCVTLAAGIVSLAVGPDTARPLHGGSIYTFVGLGLLALGMAALNAAWTSRVVQALMRADEELRVFAWGLSDRAYRSLLPPVPGVARRCVVATDERIVWTEGRRRRRRLALRLADVERFEADYRASTLTVEGDETLRLAPLTKRQLEEFERLLSSAAA